MAVAETQIVLPAPSSQFLSTTDRLAAIPEEDVSLAKEKSGGASRADRLDVRRFMTALDITDTDELRRVDYRADEIFAGKFDVNPRYRRQDWRAAV